jgi:hypothetical protein
MQNLIKIKSNSITNSTFPIKYVCLHQGGENLIPTIKWTKIKNAKSYALIMDDPDAPYPGGFVHWVIQYIPPDVNQINKNYSKACSKSNIIQGINSFGNYSYGISHRYYFKIYALDIALTKINKEPVTRDVLMSLMKNHILGYGELIKKFKNKKLSKN